MGDVATKRDPPIDDGGAPVVDIREAEPGVALVTLQDRVSKNGFSTGLSLGLRRAYETIAASERFKVVVLTGYETYFATGGTKENLLALSEGAGRFTDVNIYSLALDCPVPVISAMQGHAIGGGFVMGLFSDLVILSRESVYSANFMKYGFTPGMGATLILPRKLGTNLGQEMLLSAATYQGETLQRRSVPLPVVPRSEVMPRALELARELADKPRVALITLKEHLVQPLKEALPAVLERELRMHERTIHEPQVKARIAARFGG